MDMRPFPRIIVVRSRARGLAVGLKGGAGLVVLALGLAALWF